MHLYYFLLVIVSMACGSLPQNEIDWIPALVATTCLISGWILLSHVAARTVAGYVAADPSQAIAGTRWFEMQIAAFRWLGLAVAVFCLAGFGIARGLDSAGLGDWMFLQSIVLLLPGVVIAMGTWSAEHYYGVRLGYARAGWLGLGAAIWRTFRGAMSWLIAPILILLAASDLMRLLPIAAGTQSVLSVVGLLLFVPVVVPILIRHLFKTSPMDPDQNEWVSRLMQAAGAGRTRAVRWDTQSSQFNAMVAGFVPPLRTLFLSDRLLDELPTRQIAMVVLHEAAHLKRRHVPIRIFAVLPAWIAGAITTRWVEHYAGFPQWSMMIGSGVGITLTIAILRSISYRTEYDADATACRMAESLAGQFDQLPGSFAEASDALSAALMRVTFDHPSSRKPTWLHPGVADRIAHMRKNTPGLASAAVLSSP